MRSAAGGLLLAALLAGCASTPPAAHPPLAAAAAGDAASAVAPAIWPIDRTLYRTTAGDIYLDNLDGRIDTLRARHAAQGQALDAEKLAASLYHRYRLRGALDDAEAALALLQANEAATADGHVLRAMVFAGFHRFAEAEAALDKAVAAGADAALARQQRADLLVALGRYAALEDDFAVSAQPVGDFHELAHRADLRVLLGDLAGAERQYLAAQTLYNDTNPVPLAWLHTQMGIAFLRFGNIARAAEFFAAAVERLPGYYLAEEHLAECEVQLGKLDAARERYLRVIAQTGNPEFMSALAGLEDTRGDGKAAAQWRQQALDGYAALIDRHGTTFAHHGAGFYLERGDTARALQLARDNRALRADVGSDLLLAEAALAAGEPAEACAALQRVRDSGLRPPERGEIESALEGHCPAAAAAP
jgi:tetratricopeptide (TPR) repeat protein